MSPQPPSTPPTFRPLRCVGTSLRLLLAVRCAVHAFVFVSAVSGCASSQRNTEVLEIHAPKTSTGLLTQDVKSDGIETLRDRLNTAQAANTVAKVPPAPTPSVAAPQTPSGSQPNSSPATPGTQAEAAEPASATSKPATGALPNSAKAAGIEPAISNKLQPLPRMSSTELEELMASIQLQLESDHDYHPVAATSQTPQRPMPAGLTAGPQLARTTAEGQLRIRLGYRAFLSQPAQFWMEACLLKSGSADSLPSPDQALLTNLVQRVLASFDERRKNLESGDVERRLIRLSYVDVAGALKALKGFGVTTLEDLSEVPKPLPFASLPLVAAMPAPATNEVSLLGAEKAEKGPFELSLTPSVATPLPASVNTAPGSQLVVFFHPAHPDQFGAVKRLLDEMIDRPERQIFVEGMVLEISEEGIKELGIEWQFKEGNFEWIAGTLASGGATETLGAGFDNLKNQDRNWVAKLKGLVVEKKAEVLSRPSVLTINNRQATIRVGTDIPIATSQQDSGTFAMPGTVAFNFKYLATGISLNVMPRANEAGDKVSLLIDTIVSAQVPGSDLELRSSTGTLLASAPSMATRRIQTYARIDNNTPFIIGGLVNKEFSSVRNKIPLLGDIPYLGALFRSKHTSASKREVIVVLTPHVLEPEISKVPGDLLPKDQDQFDKIGNKLFRDSYRIRSEDLFDLSFITGNPSLQQARERAKKALEKDYRLASQPPYSLFANNRFPGDSILVRRMVFEVVRRVSSDRQKPNTQWLNENVHPEKIILFSGRQGGGGVDVQFLERLIAKTAGVASAAQFFTNNPGKALVITFPQPAPNRQSHAAVTVPVPEVHLVPCPDHRESWSARLREWNQPLPDGMARHSILLHDTSDLIRLQRAMMVKKIVELNGGNGQMSLDKLSLGKVLLFPEPKSQQFHPIDAEVALYFFQLEHYYEAALQEINQAILDLDSLPQRPQSKPRKTTGPEPSATKP